MTTELEEIFTRRVPLLDVRAPVEFKQGHAPGAVNLPLLNDDERAAIGTTYKKKGQEAAIALGHQFLTGETRELRIESWVKFFETHPEGQLYCFRGGLRSQSVRDALKAEGVDVPLIEGGYKRVRQFLIETLQHSAASESFAVVTGFTGAGKTRLLRELSRDFRVSHLEDIARHRGSAFGRWPGTQPSQATFENELAVEMLRFRGGPGPVLIEDESRMIGACTLPGYLMEAILKAPLYVVEASAEERARELIDIYLRENYSFEPGVQRASDGLAFEALEADTRRSLDAISKRIGGQETAAIHEMLTSALSEQKRTGDFTAHTEWVMRLLAVYYDPVYLRHLERESHRVVWRGPASGLAEALRIDKRPAGR